MTGRRNERDKETELAWSWWIREMKTMKEKEKEKEKQKEEGAEEQVLAAEEAMNRERRPVKRSTGNCSVCGGSLGL